MENISYTLKTMPQVVEIEENILACLLIDPNLLIVAKDRLNSKDFYANNNKLIYEQILEIERQLGTENLNYDSLLSFLKKSNDLNKIGEEKLNQIVTSVSTTFYFETYLNMVVDASVKRSVIETCKDIAESSDNYKETSQEYLDYAESKIFELSQRRKTSNFITLAEHSQEYFKLIEEVSKNKRDITGLDTGYRLLNRKINGLKKEELIILAARPAVGKSAFAVQLALNVAGVRKRSEEKKSVAFFALEMSNDQLTSRIVANVADIEAGKLHTGRLDSSEWASFRTAVDALENVKIYLDDSTTTSVGDVRSKCRKLKQSSGLDLVIIDYLQLLKSSSRDEKRKAVRQEEVSEISRMLKQMAKELKIPVIALSQLSRKLEDRGDNDKRPKLSDLRESGSLEQDADIVMFLHSEDKYERDESKHTGVVELIVGKNRQGSTGTIKFSFISAKNRFVEVEDREE